MKNFLVLMMALLCTISAFAQAAAPVEMADTLRSSGKIYVVVATIVIIFIGLAIYLFSIERRLKKIEKENYS